MCYNKIITNLDIIKTLENSTAICIIGHIDPDADALASLTVLKNFLTTKFKIATVDIFGQTDEVQTNCKFMLNGHTLNPETKKHYDTAISVDSPNIDRLGIYSTLFNNAERTYVIDHHNTNTNFGNYNIVKVSASTSEIIYDLLSHFDYKFTKQDCENIYSGIITDTNNFTTPNTNKLTFNVAGKIINKINFLDIYNNFFSNFSINNAKLLSFAII